MKVARVWTNLSLNERMENFKTKICEIWQQE